jgi:hypothetical protein
MLKSIIDRELKRQGKTFKWLVGEVGISNDGLKAGLENETIKLKDFKKMVSVLNMPIQNFFEGETTIQSIKGDYNTQASKGLIASEPALQYNKIEVEGLKKQVSLLESQLADKDKIIELLSKK